MKLSIVIPAYNEAARLPATLAAIAGFLAAQPSWDPAEVVVVDDGSSDATAQAASKGTLPRLRVLRHTANRGKGAAVRTGFAAADGALVLLSDADLAAPIEELDRLADAGPGVVAIGSRAVDRRLITTRQPVYRDLMGRVFNLAVRTVALPGVADTQCGFKLFPGPLARALAEVQQLDGFAYDVELLLLARRWGFPVREIGVHWGHVEASRVSAVRHSSEMLRDVLGLGWRRLAGRLPPPPPGLHPSGRPHIRTF